MTFRNGFCKYPRDSFSSAGLRVRLSTTGTNSGMSTERRTPGACGCFIDGMVAKTSGGSVADGCYVNVEPLGPARAIHTHNIDPCLCRGSLNSVSVPRTPREV